MPCSTWQHVARFEELMIDYRDSILRISLGGCVPIQELVGTTPKTTKPGWFARLSFRGTGSVNLVSIADPECQILDSRSAATAS
jgi:hypothetical protein